MTNEIENFRNKLNWAINHYEGILRGFHLRGTKKKAYDIIQELKKLQYIFEGAKDDESRELILGILTILIARLEHLESYKKLQKTFSADEIKQELDLLKNIYEKKRVEFTEGVKKYIERNI